MLPHPPLLNPCQLHLQPEQGYEDYMEVILARADCLRRQGGPAAERLRATFKATAELLRSYFPDYVDRSFRWVGL